MPNNLTDDQEVKLVGGHRITTNNLNECLVCSSSENPEDARWIPSSWLPQTPTTKKQVQYYGNSACANDASTDETFRW